MKRQTLAVGWDVGGWIGRKQGVAVATLAIDEVAWLGTACAFCLADLPAGWTLIDLIRKAWPAAPDDVLDRHTVVLAIDAPLGFPNAFKELLAGGEAPPFHADGPEINNPLAYRYCDRRIQHEFSKKPLSASFDKLGNNATVAMHHARRLARLHNARMLPFDSPSDDAHTFIEVYPALAKVPKSASCHPSMQRLLPTNSMADTDECDACICAIMALGFSEGAADPRLPRMVGPQDSSETNLKNEGWIFYPAKDWLRR